MAARDAVTFARPVLWAARHAPAAVPGVCYGRSDVPVSRSPEEAARALAATLPPAAVTPRTLVWSSPSPRCHEVAHRLAEHLGFPCQRNNALYELDFGTWEGRSWEAIARHEQATYEAWAAHWTRAAPPDGEALPALELRVRRWHAELDATCTHLLVAHAGVVRALRVIVGGTSWEDAMSTPIPHLTWLQVDGA